jgi:hypothetical protein
MISHGKSHEKLGINHDNIILNVDRVVHSSYNDNSLTDDSPAVGQWTVLSGYTTRVGACE